MSAIERLTFPMLQLPMARGHLDRYTYAAAVVQPLDVVNDVACGIGYGAPMLGAGTYHGYDRAGPVEEATALYGGPCTRFHACDLNDPRWAPEDTADVTVCFETLEHVLDPHRLAATLAAFTRRYVLVSIPVVPSAGINPYHLHDLDPERVPAMFPGFTVRQHFAQPDELAEVWMLRAASWV